MLMMEAVGGAFQRAKMSEDSQMLCPASGGQEGMGEREGLTCNIREHSTGLRKDRVIKITCLHPRYLEVRQFSAEVNILSSEMAFFKSKALSYD